MGKGIAAFSGPKCTSGTVGAAPHGGENRGYVRCSFRPPSPRSRGHRDKHRNRYRSRTWDRTGTETGQLFGGGFAPPKETLTPTLRTKIGTLTPFGALPASASKILTVDPGGTLTLPSPPFRSGTTPHPHPPEEDPHPYPHPPKGPFFGRKGG